MSTTIPGNNCFAQKTASDMRIDHFDCWLPRDSIVSNKMAAPKLDWEISVIYGEPTLNRSVSRRQAGLLDIHAEIPKRCEEFLEKFQVDLNRKCEEFRNEVFERPQITSKKTVKRRRGKRIKSETLGTSVMDLAKLKRCKYWRSIHSKHTLSTLITCTLSTDLL